MAASVSMHAPSSSPPTPARPTYNASQYWDDRYSSAAKHFDWFFNYSALKSFLSSFLPPGRVLHVGCGNSNLSEGMAEDGFQVTNVDISPVVIEQMRHQHADNPDLQYLVADCRHMPQLETGAFASCVDKGTLDAVLCSQSGQHDVQHYLEEVWRLLQPGGTFMLISLGLPSARLATLRHMPWTGLRVLLLPKPLLYVQSDVTLTGRPMPAKCAADKDVPVEYLGPWTAEQAEVEVQGVEVRDYFFAYVCVKPQEAGAGEQGEGEGRGQGEEGEKGKEREGEERGGAVEVEEKKGEGEVELACGVREGREGGEG